MLINEEQMEILKHANKNQGMFCGGGKQMDILCQNELMEFAGRKSFVPDPYYRITTKGRNVIK